MKTNWPALKYGCLILAGFTLAAETAPAQTAEPAGARKSAVISSVAITQAPERSAVRVEGEGKLDVRAARMQHPDRLVLDFVGARLAVHKTVIPGVSAPVVDVRMGQYQPDIARVVVDLTAPTSYNVSRDGSAVVISFNAPKATPMGVSQKSTLTTSAPEQTSQKPAEVSAHANQIPAPRFALPGELTQPSVALASFSEKKEPAHTEGNPQQAAQQAIQQANAAATTLATTAAQSAPAQTSAARYTGEPISVNLKDVDLRDFFRLIHEISGLNVVLDPAVKGSLTIVLDEVPWDQALDIVLQNNSLDKQLNGNVLRIATKSTLKSEAESQRDLVKAQAEAVEPVTVTRVLSYSKAATLKDTLKKFLSSRGDILSDDRSNQLIIRDIPSTIPTIDNLIRQLDRKSQQVEIEARVVSASRSFAQDIGTQLAFATSTGNNVFGGNSAVGVSPIFRPFIPGVSTSPALINGQPPTPPPPPTGGGTPTPPTVSDVAMPLVTNLAAGTPTSGMSYLFTSANFALDFMISAAESKGVGKLLSKPKVITQNNEKATVKQGTKIPIQTTINNTISVQYIDAVLKLEVTPQITAEGTIFMDVLVENTQIDAGIPRISGVPALDTQAAETKVTVADGGTVVIGGVIISSQRVDISEVPIAGNLPIIGNLFKRRTVTTSSQELLFFLTPRILPG
ncbi:MAG TPA: type IV pilus secretin PilQ [Candidatus Acidoferrum sp.]|nr:type IV pilus secretin PilQ [Candidatus Acidoferrum sp.]